MRISNPNKKPVTEAKRHRLQKIRQGTLRFQDKQSSVIDAPVVNATARIPRTMPFTKATG